MNNYTPSPSMIHGAIWILFIAISIAITYVDFVPRDPEYQTGWDTVFKIAPKWMVITVSLLLIGILISAANTNISFAIFLAGQTCITFCVFILHHYFGAFVGAKIYRALYKSDDPDHTE